MSRLIIENRSDIDDATVVELCAAVIREGRVSNDGKQYCYLTTFTSDGHCYQIASDLNKRSDRLTVIGPTGRAHV